MNGEKDILTKIKNEWKKDSKMDIDMLHEEAMRIPMLHSKYLDEYTIIKKLKIEKESQRKIIKLKLYNHYAGKDTPIEGKPAQRKVLGTENLVRHIEADEDMININTQIEYLNITLDFIGEVLKMIHNRSFQIKHAIDYKKFTQGLDI